VGGYGCGECGLVDCVCHLFADYDREVAEIESERSAHDAREAFGAGEEDPMSEAMEMGEVDGALKAGGAAKAKAKKSGPGSRSVIVPAEAIHARLRAAGFVEGRHGGEVIYARQHARCTHLSVIVYTTLPARGGDTRGLGEDAIRIVAMFERLTPGRDRPYTKLVAKTARVFRTGSTEAVMERTIERAREAYAECNEFFKRGECFECCKKGGR
jgi:hypothetical protein